jgi:hypothetical protein
MVRNRKIKDELDKLGHLSRRGLILHLITATGILRNSFKTKKARIIYKKASVKVIEELLDKVDRDKLTRQDIQNGISKLKRKAGHKCSYGLSQKSINVVLKYYCFAHKNANFKLLSQLDCPIDSRIISKYYPSASHNQGFRLKNLNRQNYDLIQGQIKKKERLRILGDLVYEKEYIRNSI